MALDDSRAVDGEPYLQATARAAEARMNPSTAAGAGVTNVVVISNDRGSITLPAVLDPEMVEGVVWLPSRAPRLGIPQHLAASAGDLVTIGPPTELEMGAELVEARVDDDTGASQ
jgi:NADH-quinone oxidoreductase subunit G